MYRVVKIMTDGGMCFETERDAEKHLDKKYGNKLTSIAHQILQCEKYTVLCVWLDENLPKFKELIELKSEIQRGIIGEEDN